MRTCDDCGSPCQGRYCRICGPMQRQGRDVTSGSDRAYLVEDGPHKCDICDEVVATTVALRKDCDEHGVSGGGAT